MILPEFLKQLVNKWIAAIKMTLNNLFILFFKIWKRTYQQICRKSYWALILEMYGFHNNIHWSKHGNILKAYRRASLLHVVMVS